MADPKYGPGPEGVGFLPRLEDLEEHYEGITSKPRVYTTVGGQNCIILIDGETTKSVQGISFHEQADKKLIDSDVEGAGTLIVIHNTGDNVPVSKNLMGKCLCLEVLGTDPYGNELSLFSERVKFIDYKTGVGVDDIIIEGRYTFIFRRRNAKN